MRWLGIFLLLLWLPMQAYGQEDENGFLVSLLQDQLSSDSRTVRITGVEGLLSSDAKIAEISIADADGIWLRITNARIVWTRSALLRKELRVETLSAETIDLIRLPNPDSGGSLPSAEAKPFAIPDLPILVDIGEVSANEINFEQAFLGVEAAATLTASVRIDETGLLLDVEMDRTDGIGGTLDLSANILRTDSTADIALRYSEPGNGILANALSLGADTPLRAEVNGSGPLDQLTTNLKVDTNGRTIVDGQLQLTGTETGRSFDATLDAFIGEYVVEDLEPFFRGKTSFVLRGRVGEDGAIDLPSLNISARQLSVTGRASLDESGLPRQLSLDVEIGDESGVDVSLPFANGGRVNSVEISVDLGTSAPDQWEAQWSIRDLVSDSISVIASSGSFQGQLDDRSPELQVLQGDLLATAAGIATSNSAIQPLVEETVTLNGQIVWPIGHALEFKDFALNAGSILAILDGSLSGQTFNGQAEVKTNDLQKFSALAGRNLTGGASISLNGSLNLIDLIADLEIQANTQNLTLSEPRLDPYLAGNADVIGRIIRDEAGLQITGLTVESGNALFRTEANLTSDSIRFSGDLETSEIGYALPPLAGGAKASANLSGPFSGFQTDISFETERGTFLKLTGQAGDALALSGSVQEFPLQSVSDLLPGSDLSGLLNAQLNITGTPADPEIGFRTIIEGFTSAYTRDYLPAQVSIGANGQWDARGLLLNDASLSGAGIDLSGSGRLDPDFADVELNLRGRVPLGIAEPFMTPAGVFAEGDANLAISLTGPVSNPTYSGSVQIAGVDVSVPAAGIIVRDITANLQLQGQTVSVSSLKGRLSEGGDINVSGTVGLSGALIANLAIGLDRIVLNQDRNWSATLSGDLQLTGPIASDPLVSGSLRVWEAEVLISSGGGQIANLVDIRHVSPGDATRRTLSRAGLTTAGEDVQTSQGRMTLDLEILAPNQIFVRGRGVDSEFGGAIQLRGSLDNLISTGAIQLLRGRMSLLDRRIEFVDGTIGFAGPLDPRINFNATTQVDGTQINVNLSGLASAPQLSLTSSPDLPEDEILSRLIFARPFSDLSLFQIAQLASAVAELTGEGSGGLLEQLRRASGISNLDIRTDADGETSVAAGKTFGDGFYTELELSTDGATSVNINYDVLEDVTARGSVSSDGETSIGLFYEIDY